MSVSELGQACDYQFRFGEMLTLVTFLTERKVCTTRR